MQYIHLCSSVSSEYMYSYLNKGWVPMNCEINANNYRNAHVLDIQHVHYFIKNLYPVKKNFFLSFFCFTFL